MKGFTLLNSKNKKTRKRKIIIPKLNRKRLIQEKELEIFSEDIFEEENNDFEFITGNDICPICKGEINYYYDKEKGFKIYECITNDCLPYPIGGAMKRRLNNEEKIKSKRYEKM